MPEPIAPPLPSVKGAVVTEEWRVSFATKTDPTDDWEGSRRDWTGPDAEVRARELQASINEAHAEASATITEATLRCRTIWASPWTEVEADP